MKKFLLAFLAAFFLVACGKADNPEDLAKDFITAAYEGDTDGMIDCVEVPKGRSREDVEAKLGLALLGIAGEVASRGEMKDVKVINSNENGDFATVKLEVTFGNGSKKTEVVKTYKKNGEWYISLAN